MKLNEKEIELLLLIYKAEKMGNPITFEENDHEKVKKIEKRYGKAYQSLMDKLLIDGAIRCLCSLILMQKGETLAQEILQNRHSKTKNKKLCKRNLLIGVILAILSALLPWLLYKFL